MLSNAGNKIILWSKVLFYAGIALSVVGGLFLIWRGAQTNTFRFSVYHSGYLYNAGVLGASRFIITGFLVMIFGSLCSWLTALLLRAFGDLAIDTKAIRQRLEFAPAETNTEEPAQAKPEKPSRARARKPAAPKPKEPAGRESAET